ncbi:MAG: CHAT domain-containing protein [Aureispira sp.]|nr:CHAT domain-containing protein [Aureispira sp.]
MLLRLWILMLMSTVLQAQVSRDSIELEKLILQIDSLNYWASLEIDQKKYTEAVENSTQALLINMKGREKKNILSKEGLQDLPNYEYISSVKLEGTFRHLYAGLKGKYQAEQHVKHLSLIHELNQAQLIIYHQRYLNSSSGLQKWYIDKYESLWAQSIEDAKLLELIISSPNLWSDAFDQLQLLKEMRLDYAQKNGLPLWFNLEDLPGLDKIFMQSYTAGGKRHSASELRVLLDDKTAILDFYLIGEKLQLFYLDHKTIGTYEQFVALDQLKKDIAALHKALEQPLLTELDTSYAIAAKRLYKVLLGTLVQESRGIERFVICPNRELAQVPFEVLLMKDADNKDSYDSLKYLVKSYGISYSYSSSMISDTLSLLKMDDLAHGAVSKTYKHYKSEGKRGLLALQQAKVDYLEGEEHPHPAYWKGWMRLGYQKKAAKPAEGRSFWPFLIGILCLGGLTYWAQKK